jgi:hypothetical protein
MGISSRRAGARSLKVAIEVFRAEGGDRLDNRAVELLAHLADSLDAAKAFERLKLKDLSETTEILKICIEADDVACTFQQRVIKAKKTSARMFRIFTPVADLLVFVAELIDEKENPPAIDPLSTEISEPPENVRLIWHALSLLASHISSKGRSAEEELLKLGATRKSQIAQAPENAAIGWLAEGVRRVTGRPQFSAVRDLAEVVMGTEIPDLERVRRCARARQRKLRKPSRTVQVMVRPSPEKKSLRDNIELAKRRVRPPKND